MERKLNDLFTIYISEYEGATNGVALKRLENGKGIEAIEIEKEQLSLIKALPAISSKLDEGYMLQIYQDGYMFISEIGKTMPEGPYGEETCFKVIENSSDTSLFLSISKLNTLLNAKGTNEKPAILKKEYRQYGRDKYTTDNNI